ncbi:MAG: hypothetical protein MAG715_01384 [Methanonatronarchaeales archaeon]|nr:hypothetical protein [Methanonatronarchaeales archaeon]
MTPDTIRTALRFLNNRELFSNHYLKDLLPETDSWQDVEEEEVREVREEVQRIYEDHRDRVEGYNEAQIEDNFIKPILRTMAVPFDVQETLHRGRRQPDYAFFESEEAKRSAHRQRDEGRDFYEAAAAVADAKRWGLNLDRRTRDFSNPSFQISVYLQETPVEWAVLTNGQKWRIYQSESAIRLDSYYEVDLPTLLAEGTPEDFRYFYLFFRGEAFVEDPQGRTFLDKILEKSNVFSQELGESLQDNIYEAIRLLAEGFLKYPGNDLGKDDLDIVHDSALVYLYRLIFVLYAESEGRDLLDTGNRHYRERYSLNTLKQRVCEELDSPDHGYTEWQDDLWDDLDELFELIDRGSRSRGIPKEELYVPAYNGGLFRTEVNSETSEEVRFLQGHKVGDHHLAQVIDLLTRRESEEDGRAFVDYSSLDIRHLGDIYEGLLEYRLNLAEEPMVAVRDGKEEKWVPRTEHEDGNVVEGVEEGDVYLTTDRGERKATGSYYTPEYVVQYIVENTLGPVIDDIYDDLLKKTSPRKEAGGFADQFAERVFDLKVLDPAMGSGHFLVNAVDFLAHRIVHAQDRQKEVIGPESLDESHDIHWARRQVAQKCIYGVDLNPMAVELAKVSLWLRTLAAEQPLAFLDHHLRCGNSLIGSDIEDIEQLENGGAAGEKRDEKTASLIQDFGFTYTGTIEDLMKIYRDIVSIENQDLADIKEMEKKFHEIEQHPLRKHLEALLNVKTADDFGLDIPDGAYRRMAEALEDDAKWSRVEEKDWYREARHLAREKNFFHWKLEYPEAFYDLSGGEKDDAGFDVVMGNPPYGDILDEAGKRYCRSQGVGFESERADVFTAFVALPARVLTKGAAWSYIIPNISLKGKQYEEFRRTNSHRYLIREVVDFGDNYVFDEEVFTMILKATNESPDDGYEASFVEGNSSTISTESFPFSINVGSTDAWRIADRIEAKITGQDTTVELEPTICTCHDAGIDYKVSGQGWQNRGKGTKISDLIMYEGEKESELDHRYVGGGEIERYLITPENKWLRHDYDSFIEGDIVIQVYPRYTEVDEKLLTRQTADTLIGAIDTDELYTAKSVHTTLLNNDEYDLWYVLALINSSVLHYVYQSRSGEEGRTFAQVRIHELRDLPIRRIDFEIELPERSSRIAEIQEQFESANSIDDFRSEIELQESHEVILHDFLGFLAKERTSYTNQRKGFNLNLPDYLGSYSPGQTLADLYQPPSGLASTILTETAEDRENLRVGSVSVEKKGSKLVLYVSARYKPEKPEEFETDRWGYTETETMPAMEFAGLSEKQEALIEEFVPLAVDEAGGFADFRETATKTKSLIDRLEALTLPRLSDVEDGLERFLEVKAEAEELDEKIQKTDELIDQIVYELYGLTEEEIAVVEGAIG